MRAYAYWIRGEFPEAKRWAAEGVQLKTASKVDTAYDCAHALALARRDLGDYEEALNYFLQGEKIETLVSGNVDAARKGPFYGNIGRCLQLLERYEDALVCLKASAYLLETEHDYSNILLNRGWAAMWIGEVQVKKANTMRHTFLFEVQPESGKWFHLDGPRTHCEMPTRL